ncbi:unnamed protein product [Spodoptera exigua]|nr:unnamed protein product [Spodoptera exigua]
MPLLPQAAQRMLPPCRYMLAAVSGDPLIEFASHPLLFIHNPTRRVIDGKPASPAEVPYQIAFKKRSDRDHGLFYTFCGGALIGSTKILTAAHCFVRENYPLFAMCLGYTYLDDLTNTYAVAGSLRNIARQKEPHEQWRPIHNITYPPSYRFPENDIAVVFVLTPYTLNDLVQPIDIADTYENYEGYCLVSGYGEISNQVTSDTLMKAHLLLLANERCPRITQFRNLFYNICTSAIGAEIGIYASSPFEFNNHVAPIPYAKRHTDYNGKCLVSGYGRTGHGTKDTTEILLLANLEIMPNSLCGKVHRKRMENFVCTFSSFTDVGKRNTTLRWFSRYDSVRVVRFVPKLSSATLNYYADIKMTPNSPWLSYASRLFYGIGGKRADRSPDGLRSAPPMDTLSTRGVTAIVSNPLTKQTNTHIEIWEANVDDARHSNQNSLVDVNLRWIPCFVAHQTTTFSFLEVFEGTLI